MKPEAGEAVDIHTGEVILRPRLTRLLDQASARIVLFLAPAGYGKTTLAREWLDSRPHVWYRGSSASADVAALALGLARASASLVPCATERLATRLRVSGTSTTGVEDLAELLADDLAEWPSDAWLVFDDYHLACDSESAELFVEHLAASSPIRLLVASRSRPRWASARRLLYGEVFEVGRNLLSMNQEEAYAILRSHRESESETMVTIADGWPALLGLAALGVDFGVLQERTPDELYNYFAEELYQGLPAHDQRGLRLLSLAPLVTRELGRTLLGDDAERVIQTAVDLGFFLGSSSKSFEFHPLLRSFLASKFAAEEDDPDGSAISALTQHLLKREQWDDAFEIIEKFFTAESLRDLLAAALPRMVDEARLPTLCRWTRAASAHRADSPFLDFTEAEVALANGEWRRAEALAVQAARRGLPPAFDSKAYWIAGTSAHMAFRTLDSLTYFSQAADSATSRNDEQQSLWGRFMANIKLDNETEATDLLNDLTKLSGGTADEIIRIATGRLNLASIAGNLVEALHAADLATHLTPRSRDPLIQTSFLHSYGALLALNARYEEALEIARMSLDVATNYRLIFPIAYARFELAVAFLGLRNFRNGDLALRPSAQAAREGNDAFLGMNAAITAARFHLATGSIAKALDILERHQHLSSSTSMKGEYFAWWALAFALGDAPDRARTLAADAEALTRRIEVVGSTPWVEAVLALKSNRGTNSRLKEAWHLLLETGNIDVFVTAYRACPELLQAASAQYTWRNKLREILEQAHDHKLAERVGLPLPPIVVSGGPSFLTRREREVLELVTQGLANKEIGRALFITEATVKVHVRRICQKLGVRSRTEAAMRAAEING